jgi:UDP-N-acetylglucosamine 2-epimerase (non-hydrolysing)
MKKKIFLIAAARPNFMKIAPLYHVLRKKDWASPQIIHTGQHYDLNMSDWFFKDLRLLEPHINLEVGSGTHAEQVGRVMMAFETVALREKPDLTIVVGDVNSTMACAIAAVKLGLMTAHLEAGLRSFDRTMPEEINRLVTDALADILWTPSADADENLLREGIDGTKISRVGNIMIDSFELLKKRIKNERGLADFNLEPRKFAVVTLHRPVNVDEKESIRNVCKVLSQIAEKIPILFPVHPRTRKQMEQFDLLHTFKKTRNIILTEPLNYIKFMNLVLHAKLVITDSGGIQEETTYLGIPCLTLRENTERPITISAGTNRLCNLSNIHASIDEILAGRPRKGNVPELWDGKTAHRVVQDLETRFKIKD